MANELGGVNIFAVVGTLSAIAGTGVAVIGSVIARERYILRTTQEWVDAATGRMDGHVSAAIDKVDNELTALHGRVSSIRDTYVRRDDLEMHLSKIESTTNLLRNDVKELAEAMRAELKEHRKDSATQNKELMALVVDALKKQP